MWYSWPPRVLQTLAWGPTRTLLLLFTGFTVMGAHNLKRLPQAIFAVNHASELDPIIITAALNPLSRFTPLFYVVAPFHHFKSENFGWRRRIYTPTFFRAWGAYAAERGFRDYAKSLRDHTSLVRDGRSVVIFPEGGIARDGVHHKAQGGVAYLSAATGVPVVPVAISGSYRLGPKMFLRRKGKLRVTFGVPLYPKDLFGDKKEPTGEDCKKASQLIMQRVAAHLA